MNRNAELSLRVQSIYISYKPEVLKSTPTRSNDNHVHNIYYIHYKKYLNKQQNCKYRLSIKNKTKNFQITSS